MAEKEKKAKPAAAKKFVKKLKRMLLMVKLISNQLSITQLFQLQI